MDDLRFDLRYTSSYELIASKIRHSNFLEWIELRNSLPSNLKSASKSANLDLNPSFSFGSGVFAIKQNKRLILDNLRFLVKRARSAHTEYDQTIETAWLAIDLDTMQSCSTYRA